MAILRRARRRREEDDMKRRQLGEGGPTLSVLGLGGWKFGGSWLYGLGESDDENSVATIERAIDAGVNWVDTAPIYGLGRSEEVIGRALADHPDVLVNTKCGHHPSPDGKSTYVDNSPDVIKRECNESLRRLGRDHIDIYQFHLPDTEHPVEESWGAMLELIQEGKVRWAGGSNFTVEMLRACEPLGHMQVTEPQYNLLHREVEAELLPWCEENGTGVVCYETQQTGLLSGAFSREHLAHLAADDFRHTFADFQEPTLTKALDLVEELQPIATGLGVTVGELAIAFTLAHPAVTGAIVGASSPEQVDGWAAAGDLELDEDVVDRIVELATAAGFSPEAQAGYTSVDSRVQGAA
jgi:aryl-alcohol dehydrogenase-like predicted oxidoreductase